MPLTAAQMATLTVAQNVAGFTTDGRLLYRTFIGDKVAWTRIQELTHQCVPGVPPWYYSSHDGTGWWILTTEPAWFIELEQEIINARRPR